MWDFESRSMKLCSFPWPPLNNSSWSPEPSKKKPKLQGESLETGVPCGESEATENQDPDVWVKEPPWKWVFYSSRYPSICHVNQRQTAHRCPPRIPDPPKYEQNQMFLAKPLSSAVVNYTTKDNWTNQFSRPTGARAFFWFVNIYDNSHKTSWWFVYSPYPYPWAGDRCRYHSAFTQNRGCLPNGCFMCSWMHVKRLSVVRVNIHLYCVW